LLNVAHGESYVINSLELHEKLRRIEKLLYKIGNAMICNRGRGTWKSAGPNQLQFGPLALTRAMCRERLAVGSSDSLDD
jgi:hypothetical protein